MFSKKPEQNSPAPRATPVANHANHGGSTFSVFGPDVVIKGDVEASADLHVDGTIHGDLTCSSLVQGEGGRIEGAIRAESARISGTVKGTIHASELVVLRSARIEGDVAYDSLTIEQGAHVEGRFGMRDRREAKEVAAAQPEAIEAKDMDGKEPKLHLAN